MKPADAHNIHFLSKKIYLTNVMPSGDSGSFTEVAAHIIRSLLAGADKDKLSRIIHSELITKYGMYPAEELITEITDEIYQWFHY